MPVGKTAIPEKTKATSKTGGRGGKGGKQNDAAGEQQKPTDEDALAAVKAELTALQPYALIFVVTRHFN
ncbi:hypothetical protein ACT453_31950, partial [Bacillus sp. D-CC]